METEKKNRGNILIQIILLILMIILVVFLLYEILWEDVFEIWEQKNPITVVDISRKYNQSV